MLQVQELVLEFICSRTTVRSRTSSVQELQFKNFVSSRTTVQELCPFKTNSSRTTQVHEPKFFKFKNFSWSS